MSELREALDRLDWGAAAGPIEGLGRLRAGEAVPLLKTAWTESTYAYLRPRVLTALTRTAPHTAESYTVEGLWDCEERVRHEAAQLAPSPRTPGSACNASTTTRPRIPACAAPPPHGS
ncbi:hypothetical protein [Actinomadura sp. J1-007]|nr:hypothetical protein [Actinomadura sp. J1-007]